MVMFVKSSYFFEHISSCGKTLSSRHGKPGRTHWSRSGRNPCSVERVASAQTFSRREWIRRFAWFHTRGLILYVRTGKMFFFFGLGSHERTAQTYTW